MPPGWDPPPLRGVGVGHLAIRFLAAASDAFLARALRWAAVMFFAAALPPFDPIAAIACRSITRVSFAIPLSYPLGDLVLDGLAA